MGFADYLASLNLDPKTAETIASRYGDVNADPVTPEEVQRYSSQRVAPIGTPFGPPTPDQTANAADQTERSASAAGRIAGADSSKSQTNPYVADPNFNPAEETKRTEAFNAAKAREAAPPQGPAGGDGFPSYRDPASMGNGGGASASAPSGPARIIPGTGNPDSARSRRRDPCSIPRS
jgi:hypothetical protein